MKVFIIAALTVDGFIGRSSDHLSDWTGGEDKKVFVRLTKEAGTIVMGRQTFETIGRALPGRRNIVYTHDPSKVTVEGVETTTETPQALIDRLASEGASALAICGGAAIYELFMAAGVVDELYITYVPAVFGTGLGLFMSERATALTLLETSTLSDGSVLAHYAVKR